jgi:predicted transcriptional regulator
VSTTSTTLTVRLPPELKERLGELAERTRRTRSFLAGEAIAGYVARELEIIGAIERGLEDVRAGRVVPHDEAMRRIRATIAGAAKERESR